MSIYMSWFLMRSSSFPAGTMPWTTQSHCEHKLRHQRKRVDRTNMPKASQSLVLIEIVASAAQLVLRQWGSWPHIFQTFRNKQQTLHLQTSSNFCIHCIRAVLKLSHRVQGRQRFVLVILHQNDTFPDVPFYLYLCVTLAFRAAMCCSFQIFQQHMQHRHRP